MDSIFFRTWILLLVIPCFQADPLQCFGNNFNETLDNIIHLSDVILVGRIVEVKEGNFGTYSADVSFLYSLKSDEFLPKKFFSHSKVTNFSPEPTNGMINFFFLNREPNMQLALLCMASETVLIQYTGLDFQMILVYISNMGKNDTIRNDHTVVPYPNPCDAELCGRGAYCSLRNTLPGDNKRCSCLTGFSRTTSSGPCHTTSEEALASHCAECTHAARCDKTSTHRTVCTCDQFLYCKSKTTPMCGTDGVTYYGACRMRNASCVQQKTIHKLYDGKCLDEVPQACLGLGEPLMSPAGLFQCSANVDICPTQYFCHTTKMYSICCPVMVGLESNTSSPPVSQTQSLPTPVQPSHQPPVHCSTGSGGSGSYPEAASSGGGGDDDTEAGDC